MNILEIIQPIKLLKGSHPDTAKTGHGCAMNVIAYLNGESVITDNSECVCFVVRPLLIFINDHMTDSERPILLPFLLRAMGSRTDNKEEILRRLWLVKELAGEMALIAAKYVVEHIKYIDNYTMQYAVEYAVESDAKSVAVDVSVEAARYASMSAKYASMGINYSAMYSAESAVMSARYAVKAIAMNASDRYIGTRGLGFSNLILKFLDDALPKQEIVTEEIHNRALRLVELASA